MMEGLHFKDSGWEEQCTEWRYEVQAIGAVIQVLAAGKRLVWESDRVTEGELKEGIQEAQCRFSVSKPPVVQ